MSQTDDQNRTIFEQYQQDLLQLPQALAPKFISPLPISPIVLYQGDITLNWNNSSVLDQGTIELNWFPSPSINFRIILDRIILPPEGPLSVNLNAINRSLSGYGLSPGFKINESGSSMTLHGPILGEHTKGPIYAERASFHLVNFHRFFGETIAYKTPSGKYGRSMGRINMRNEKWIVTIDDIQYDVPLWDELKQTRGYGITHTGTLQRNDGTQFLVEEAEEVLDALVFLLAFLRGNWVGPILVTYEGEKDTDWLDLKLRNTSRWHSSHNWFPRTPIKSDGEFDELFDNFLKLWNDELWKHALRTIAFWYVESTVSQSAEAGIVLASNVLELLFWVYCVESPDTRLISKTQADKMHLEDMISKLLELSHIPEEIPDHFEALRKIANKFDAKPD